MLGEADFCCSMLSCIWLVVTPWTAALHATLFFINSWSLLKIMFIELVILSNHLILCFSLLLLSSIFHSIQVFSNESALSFNWFIKTLIFKVVNDIFELISTIFVTLFYLLPLFFAFFFSLFSDSCDFSLEFYIISLSLLSKHNNYTPFKTCFSSSPRVCNTHL